ncbi:MAG: DsbA family protein [Actinobacteria bacterium]|nr:DsbA family protein [Actinomycetota bacterium]
MIPVTERTQRREQLDLGLGRAARPDLELIYVGDPMCSWCWGFAPVLERLDTRLDIPLRTIMGGLRTGGRAEPMGAPERVAMGRYWRQVAETTGQRFTTAALEHEGWAYDTEPACRAVVALRQLAPQNTLRWLARVHRAFYVEGVDVTDLSVFPDLLEGFYADRDEYRQVLHDPATLEQTRRDIEQARDLGVAGFPTVLLRDGDDLAVVTRGYVPGDQLEPALARWLEERYGDVGSGLTCDPASGIC